MKRLAAILLAMTMATLSSAETALDLVRRYNARPIAAQGWQSVDLDLLSGDTVTRHFGVVNAWAAAPGIVSTLFLLRTPEGLRGTNYLLKEPRDRTDVLDVFLHLPVGLKQVIALEPAQLDEGLLGSDFAYRDIRWLLPEQGMTYAVVGRDTIGGGAVTVIEARPDTQTAATVLWDHARFYIGDAPLFLMGADYFTEDATGETAMKKMRVDDIARIDGHWIATRMTMRVGADRWSRITLRDVEFAAKGYGAEAFLPASLPILGTALRETGAATLHDGGQADE
ncbi:outer membrane lipoprotein-sorting protein [Primorskyibacter sp. 2E107]|uniref:outer membrane lipoprotein-sorting protein n=1 Tax=Primorskyibacter sp. 2E107 TaxID=3403458 RepID=UPI003AF9E7EE